MEKIELKAKTREVTGRQNNQIRREEYVPAVLYGHGIENQNLQILYNELEKVFNQAGESTLIDLSVDGKEPVKALIHA